MKRSDAKAAKRSQRRARRRRQRTQERAERREAAAGEGEVMWGEGEVMWIPAPLVAAWDAALIEMWEAALMGDEAGLRFCEALCPELFTSSEPYELPEEESEGVGQFDLDRPRSSSMSIELPNCCPFAPSQAGADAFGLVGRIGAVDKRTAEERVAPLASPMPGAT